MNEEQYFDRVNSVISEFAKNCGLIVSNVKIESMNSSLDNIASKKKWILNGQAKSYIEISCIFPSGQLSVFFIKDKDSEEQHFRFYDYIKYRSKDASDKSLLQIANRSLPFSPEWLEYFRVLEKNIKNSEISKVLQDRQWFSFPFDYDDFI